VRPLSRTPRPQTISVWMWALLLPCIDASGFDAIDPQPGIRTPLERAVESPLPTTTCEGCLLFAMSHRPWGEAFDDPARDLFGYDGGFLRVRLDLRLGLFPGFDVGLTRTNGVAREAYDSWSGDLRLTQNWKPRDGWSLDAGVQGGGTWFEQENAPDASAPWVWSGVGVGFDPLWIGGGVEWHGNSSSPWKSSESPDATLAIHGQAILRVRENLAMVGEISQPVSGYGLPCPAWTIGPRWTTWRHIFSVWLGNARSGGPDGRLVGARSWGKPVLGFQIAREATMWNTEKPQ
jgi:hypothetical protein